MKNTWLYYFTSYVYKEIYTDAAYLNGLLNKTIDEVVLPTVVEIGIGSILVGNFPLP